MILKKIEKRLRKQEEKNIQETNMSDYEIKIHILPEEIREYAKGAAEMVAILIDTDDGSSAYAWRNSTEQEKEILYGVFEGAFLSIIDHHTDVESVINTAGLIADAFIPLDGCRTIRCKIDEFVHWVLNRQKHMYVVIRRSEIKDLATNEWEYPLLDKKLPTFVYRTISDNDETEACGELPCIASQAANWCNVNISRRFSGDIFKQGIWELEIKEE